MNITGKIQTLRKEKGWSIARLAKETGMPTISLRVMLSREDPNRYTIKNLKKIADALGVTVSYLTLEDDEHESPSITATQSEGLKALITSVIDEYFTIRQPKPVALSPAPPEHDEFDYGDDEELED